MSIVCIRFNIRVNNASYQMDIYAHKQYCNTNNIIERANKKKDRNMLLRDGCTKEDS